MHEIIQTSLNGIGLNAAHIHHNASLVDIGLDSLMTVLLISKIEENVKKDIQLEDFKQEKFESINSIHEFLTSTGGL